MQSPWRNWIVWIMLYFSVEQVEQVEGFCFGDFFVLEVRLDVGTQPALTSPVPMPHPCFRNPQVFLQITVGLGGLRLE